MVQAHTSSEIVPTLYRIVCVELVCRHVSSLSLMPLIFRAIKRYCSQETDLELAPLVNSAVHLSFHRRHL
jgi:hypothetical protein